MSWYSLYNWFNRSDVTGPAIPGPNIFATAAAPFPYIPGALATFISLKNSGGALLLDKTLSINSWLYLPVPPVSFGPNFVMLGTKLK